VADRDGFVFDGGVLCLDFANTELMSRDRRVDRLERPDDLVRWLDAAGVLATPDLRSAVGRWRPVDADSVLRTARDLRLGFRRVLENAVACTSVVPGVGRRLGALANRLIASRPQLPTLVWRHGRFFKEERTTGDDPRRVLAPIAASVRDLLTDGSLERVRQCSDPACVIFFLDQTKNRSRRWCNMARCGVRAKMATYHRRARRRRADR
jgi:predicted RNA-binding Zn ribbon-like protein